MRVILLALVWVCTSFSCFSQSYFSVSSIPDSLKTDANAIVREEKIQINIDDLDDVIITKKRVVTVLNSKGDQFVRSYDFHDKTTRIEDQVAYIYNKEGVEIERFKKKEFTDVSSFGSSTLFSDSRVSYITYQPREYPYTLEYHSKINSDNSVFLPPFRPIEAYNLSIQKKAYEIINPNSIPIRFDKVNFEKVDLLEKASPSNLYFEVKNLKAWDHEILSPELDLSVPLVKIALDKFMLEGVEGEAKNWKDFGYWYHKNLLTGRGDLPEATVQKIQELTKDAITIEDKARIIYQFVQDNTRYISVQLGIGGWQPATAKEVDELGYGDCKALTNYTQALLKSQGINSYYTVIYGGDKQDIDPDFTRMMGDHVILNVPDENNNDMWLECTSQTVPFNYIADFTDDRYALKITPQGGEIVRTTKYTAQDNLEEMDCDIQLQEDGSFTAVFKRDSYGVGYGDIYHVENWKETDQKRFYRNEWSDLQNIKFQKISFSDHPEEIKFHEEHEISGEHLAVNAGQRLLVPLNFIQQDAFFLASMKNRTRPLKISKGRTYKDHFTFQLPEGFTIEALPDNEKLVSDFGEFSLGITATDSQIKVDRYLLIKEGEWSAERYEDFRQFIDRMSYLNNLKAVIINQSK